MMNDGLGQEEIAQIAVFAAQREGEYLHLLERLVSINSHADNPAGLRACGEIVSSRLATLGFATWLEEAQRNGLTRHHLVATRAATAPAAQSVLVLGHLDTVFPEGHEFARLYKQPDRWIGPGVSDMKGGVVTALMCLELLARLQTLSSFEWRVVFVADEETIAPTGHVVLERLARGVDYALSFEAARPNGDLVIARKGIGLTQAIVRGRTGHAGIDHDHGINAFSVLCDFVRSAEALEQEFEDLTVSPGGEVLVEPRQVNVIPNLARAELEWRFTETSTGSQVIERLAAVAADFEHKTKARIELRSSIDTPPMAEVPKSQELLALYRQAARTLGFEVNGTRTAGVGDINFVSGLGPVCLDGLGPLGGDFHSEREYVLPQTIAQRATMNALALHALAHRPREPSRLVVDLPC